METSLSPLLISQKVFGLQTLYNRRNVLNNAWLTLVLSFLALSAILQADFEYKSVTQFIKNDDYEQATMFMFSCIRHFVLFFSIIPTLKLRILKSENVTNIFKSLSKIKDNIKCNGNFNLKLKIFTISAVTVVWFSSAILIVLTSLHWRNSEYYYKETIVVFRGVHSLIEVEMMMLVWMQQQLFQNINNEIVALDITNEASVNHLCTLRELHFDLCEICGEICEVYQSHLLFNMIVSFTDTTDCAYYFLVASLNLSKKYENNRVMVITDSLVWAILACIMKLVNLAVICAGATNECSRTYSELLKLNNHCKRQMYCLREEIKTFREQIQHTTVHYSIFSSIPLNISLIYLLSGGVVNCLLVLIQFHTIEHPEPCPT